MLSVGCLSISLNSFHDACQEELLPWQAAGLVVDPQCLLDLSVVGPGFFLPFPQFPVSSLECHRLSSG